MELISKLHGIDNQALSIRQHEIDNQALSIRRHGIDNQALSITSGTDCSNV